MSASLHQRVQHDVHARGNVLQREEVLWAAPQMRSHLSHGVAGKWKQLSVEKPQGLQLAVAPPAIGLFQKRSQDLLDSSGDYICKSVVNYLRHGNYICKSEGIHLQFVGNRSFYFFVMVYPDTDII